MVKRTNHIHSIRQTQIRGRICKTINEKHRKTCCSDDTYFSQEESVIKIYLLLLRCRQYWEYKLRKLMKGI